MRTVLWVCLSIVLLFAIACGTTSISGIGIDPAFRTLVAPNTTLLTGVDVDALKASEFYKRHEKQLDTPFLAAATERMGVNPLRDISQLLASWDGKTWIFMVRGRFNGNDLEKRMVGEGASTTAYSGHTLVGSNGTSFVFLKNVAVEGSGMAVRAAVDRHSTGTGAVPQELKEKLAILSKRDQVWAASRGGLAFADMPMNPDIQSALSNFTGSVSGTTGGIYFDAGVHLSLDIQCVSDQSATRVHDGLRGVIGFGRLSTKDNQEDLLRAYDAIQVSKENRMVKVRADLAGNLADELIATFTAIKEPGKSAQ